MKKLIIGLCSLLISSSLFAQPTQINGNQIKDQAITNAKIKNDAAIHYSKINFTAIPPSVLGLEGPLTFNSPMSKTGTTVSLLTVNVPFGGTGLTSIEEGFVPFGNTNTALNTNANFFWDNALEKLSVTALKVTSGTPALGYVLSATDIDGNVTYTDPALVIPANTIVTDDQVVVGTGTSIEGDVSFLYDGTTVTVPTLKVTGGTPTIGYVLSATDVDGNLAYADPAAVIPANTIVTDDQVVIGTGTSIEGAGIGLTYDGTTLVAPALKLTSEAPTTVGYVLAANNSDGTLGFTNPAFVKTEVEEVTSTKGPTAAESNEFYTNEGDADGATVTLPSAIKGLTYSFGVQTGQVLTVTAGAGDTIRISGSATAAAGSVTSSVVGSTLTLTAINATEWFATSVVGTWSF